MERGESKGGAQGIKMGVETPEGRQKVPSRCAFRSRQDTVSEADGMGEWAMGVVKGTDDVSRKVDEDEICTPQ
jgi:hypothetical protein